MKKIIPFLISLVTLASCTGMLDDMQSQIDDLDSRVTALEKDSKLISENLSTVKNDLEAGLSAIVALQKSTAEIADTLAAHKARLQNDMEVSMRLIKTALSNIDELKSTDTKLAQSIDELKSTDTKLAQSIVDAYASIDVVTNLIKTNKNEIEVLNRTISSVKSRLTSLESSVNSLKMNSIVAVEVKTMEDYVYYGYKNSYGFLLSSKFEYGGYTTEYFFDDDNRNKVIYRGSYYVDYTEYYYYSEISLVRFSKTYYSGCSSPFIALEFNNKIHVSEGYIHREEHVHIDEYGQRYFPYCCGVSCWSDGEPVRIIKLYCYDCNYWCLYFNDSSRRTQLGRVYDLTSDQAVAIKNFFNEHANVSKCQEEGFYFSDFLSSWNSFIESSELFDNVLMI